jgi:hypothetical protein
MMTPSISVFFLQSHVLLISIAIILSVGAVCWIGIRRGQSATATVLIPLICLYALLVALVAPVPSPMDESAHYAYIESLAVYHRLPILTDQVDPYILAIAQGTYPKAPTSPAQYSGTRGIQYESLQPPLYYLSAVPVYLVGSPNHLAKLYALRVYSVVLLALALWALCRMTLALGAASRLAVPLWLPYAMVVFLGFIPTVVVRSASVSNYALSLLLSVVFWWYAASLFAPVESNSRYVFLHRYPGVLFGTLLAAVVLTRFVAYIYIPAALILLVYWCWYYRLTWSASLRQVTALFGVLTLLVAPWIGFNYYHYGAPTATGPTMVRMYDSSHPVGVVLGWDNYVLPTLYPFFLQSFYAPDERYAIAKPPVLPTIPYIALDRLALVPSIIFLIAALWVLCRASGGLWQSARSGIQTLRDPQYVPLVIAATALGLFVVGIAQHMLGTLYADWPLLFGRYLHAYLGAMLVIFTISTSLLSRGRYRSIIVILAICLPVVSATQALLYSRELSNLPTIEETRKDMNKKVSPLPIAPAKR